MFFVSKRLGGRFDPGRRIERGIMIFPGLSRVYHGGQSDTLSLENLDEAGYFCGGKPWHPHRFAKKIFHIKLAIVSPSEPKILVSHSFLRGRLVAS